MTGTPHDSAGPQVPEQTTATDANLRAQYLTEVLGLLYPRASVVPGGAPSQRDPGAGPVLAEYLVVPHAREPKLLVPATDRRVAAAAVRRFAEPTSRKARLKRDAVVTALRTGADRVLLRDRVAIVGTADTGESINQYLAGVLGMDLAIGVVIGAARANRKPVIQLLTAEGDTIGFGKLGTTPLTQALVRAETAALSSLNRAALNTLRVPRVLHAGQWQGHEVLIQSALPKWEPAGRLTTSRLAAAMAEVARSLGTHTSPLAADPYWKALRGRLDAVLARPAGPARPDGSDAAAEARTLGIAAEDLIASAGGVELTFGAWHGDWSPWNMATTVNGMLVWDWERFTGGVPVGYDAIHFDLQRLLDRGVEPRAAVQTTLSRAERLLEPFGVGPAEASVTALLYLVDLATRYLEDGQAEAGARLGVLGTWLLPVLTAKVATT